MRYVLQRKSDGKFDRGREYWGEDRWHENFEKAFFYQTEKTPGNKLWVRDNPPACTCPRSKSPYARHRCRLTTCPLNIAQRAMFDATYKVIGVKLRLVE